LKTQNKTGIPKLSDLMSTRLVHPGKKAGWRHFMGTGTPKYFFWKGVAVGVVLSLVVLGTTIILNHWGI